MMAARAAHCARKRAPHDQSTKMLAVSDVIHQWSGSVIAAAMRPKQGSAEFLCTASLHNILRRPTVGSPTWLRIAVDYIMVGEYARARTP